MTSVLYFSFLGRPRIALLILYPFWRSERLVLLKYPLTCFLLLPSFVQMNHFKVSCVNEPKLVKLLKLYEKKNVSCAQVQITIGIRITRSWITIKQTSLENGINLILSVVLFIKKRLNHQFFKKKLL